MRQSKVGFFGTPEFAADLLEKIIATLPVDISFVVTQPDAPIGRKKIITPSLVKQIAQKHGIKIYESLEIPESEFKKIDLAIIYYYGKIIPRRFLDFPKYGFWNIHFSRLPQYRGPTPATFSLIMGDTQTAVSLVLTHAKMDYGPLISQDIVSIDDQTTRLELEKKLHDMLPGILEREFNNIKINTQKLSEQDHDKATYTLFPTRDHGFVSIETLKKAMNNEPLTTNEIPSLIKDYLEKNKIDDGSIDLQNSGKVIFNYYRGLHFWPGIWTKVYGKRMKILDAGFENSRFAIKMSQFEGKTPEPFRSIIEI